MARRSHRGSVGCIWQPQQMIITAQERCSDTSRALRDRRAHACHRRTPLIDSARTRELRGNYLSPRIVQIRPPRRTRDEITIKHHLAIIRLLRVKCLLTIEKVTRSTTERRPLRLFFFSHVRFVVRCYARTLSHSFCCSSLASLSICNRRSADALHFQTKT